MRRAPKRILRRLDVKLHRLLQTLQRLSCKCGLHNWRFYARGRWAIDKGQKKLLTQKHDRDIYRCKDCGQIDVDFTPHF